MILPSECYENVPLDVMESYSMGRPVIGAEIGGIPELVKAGQTRLTFQGGSSEALAQAMRTLAEAPDDRIAEMAATGQTWVEKDFADLTYHRRRLVDLYRQLGVVC